MVSRKGGDMLHISFQSRELLFSLLSTMLEIFLLLGVNSSFVVIYMIDNFPTRLLSFCHHAQGCEDIRWNPI